MEKNADRPLSLEEFLALLLVGGRCNPEKSHAKSEFKYGDPGKRIKFASEYKKQKR